MVTSGRFGSEKPGVWDCRQDELKYPLRRHHEDMIWIAPSKKATQDRFRTDPQPVFLPAVVEDKPHA